jgi:diguanylate cyclase (GGDEF)-like protein/PAS domain S-box-containing protein
MVLELLKSAALLLALCTLQSLNLRINRARPGWAQVAGGMLFGSICCVGMMQPLVVVPWAIFDPRSVILLCAGLFGGPVVALIAGALAAGYRIYLGGPAVVVACLVIAACVLSGLAYRNLYQRGKIQIGPKQLLTFGFVVHAVLAALTSLAVPPGTDVLLELQVIAAVLLVFTPATLLLGYLLQDINHRLTIEKALNIKEARLRAIAAALPDLLFVMDVDGRYLEIVSGAGTAAYGDVGALVGLSLSDVLSPKDAQTFLEHLRKTVKTGEMAALDFDFPTQAGVRRFEARLQPLENAPRAKPVVLALNRDITEQSQARKNLQISELRFRTALQDISSMAVQGYLPSGEVIYWNSTCERLFGYTEAEAMGSNVADLILPQESRAELKAAIAGMAESGKVVPAAQWKRLHKNGTTIDVFSSYAVVDHGDGPRELFCFDLDLADQIHAEAELRIAATAFEAQEGIMVTDPELKILRVNQSFTRITGYTPSDAVGHTPSFLNSDRQPPGFYADLRQRLTLEGSWEGEVWERRKSGDIYPQWLNVKGVLDGHGALVNYVVTFTDITQRKAAEEEIRRLAFYDPLTQLPNRRLLMDRLKQSLAATARNGQTGALLFIDLDHFKVLNDTMGHDVGDLLLQEVGKRLNDGVRLEDTVARLGGDEFVVMLEGLGEQSQEAAAKAIAITEKLMFLLNRPYVLTGVEYHNTPSIGITLFSGANTTLEDLLKQADLAMYKAKNSGRNGMQFFDPQMQEAVTLRARRETEIRQGILNEEFRLFYQPQVNVYGEVIGAEALIRWVHPLHGLVSPAEFIPVAEESGQILALGSWVLEMACHQLVAWAADVVTENLTLSVNVSARQFRQPDFVEQVIGVLDYTGARAQCLKLELTESLLADDVEELAGKMAELRVRKVGFSLDDFGTGYSSLSYLKRLPLDQLKIDQSFIQDIDQDNADASIAKTIITLGRGLGLSVIAEGVETQAQRQCLLDAGCMQFQGYLFGYPMPPEHFQNFAKSAHAQLSSTY